MLRGDITNSRPHRQQLKTKRTQTVKVEKFRVTVLERLPWYICNTLTIFKSKISTKLCKFLMGDKRYDHGKHQLLEVDKWSKTL